MNMAREPASPILLQYPIASGRFWTRVLEVQGYGPPIVLLHGAGARADRWRTSLAVLGAQGMRAIAVDLPGHGFASKGPELAYSISAFAAFVGDALDELAVTSAMLVGTSVGAHVAARLALDRPEVVDRLVMVGPTGLLPLGEAMRCSIASNLRNATPEGIRRKLARVIADGSSVDESWITEEWRINTSPGAAESFELLAQYVESRLDEDEVASGLKEATDDLDVMVLWGKEDAVVPVGSPADVRHVCGRAEVAYVPNAGHLPYAENGDAFWAAVLPFIRNGNPTTA